MLRFACVAAHVLDSIRSGGLPLGTPLFDSLGKAKTFCRTRYDNAMHLLVVDASSLALDDDGALAIPASADLLLNLDPYLPPREVMAAGGLVVRKQNGKAEVLAIHRRGVWDLPKGKQDEGETIAETALREVREEVGIETLRSLGEAGRTVHGYAEKGRYRVKTTYWYWMATPQVTFVPEAREGIEQVAYVPWAEASARLGYDTLRALVARLDPDTVLR